MLSEEFCTACDHPIRFGQFTSSGRGPFCSGCLPKAEATDEDEVLFVGRSEGFGPDDRYLGVK